MDMTWNLKSIYDDKTFAEDVAAVKRGLNGDVLELQEAAMLLRQLSAYVSCRIAQNTADADAHAKNGVMAQLETLCEEAYFKLGRRLVNEPGLAEKYPDVRFFLEELREWAKAKGENEVVLNALSADGYHGYWTLYQLVTGKIRIGELSVGQAYNLLSDANRDVRVKAFTDWTEGWKGQADVVGQILNNMGGFRLQMYGLRKWDDILFEPLWMNRMKKETFDAMWGAINEAKPIFVRYLEAKAKLLGVKKLSWVDVEAPLGKMEEVPYEDAATSIVAVFDTFHPRKGAFAREVFEKRWIEAEDREGKAAGGFCVCLPKTRESRIFMTYMGTPINVATLAHELGHAYHNRCVEHLPYFAQVMRMNVAETASTFAEMVMIDDAISRAKSQEEKRQLLDDKLQRSIAYFMNIQSRVLFEQSFYEERKKGFVSVDRLCELMVAAQKEAYCDSLADYDPYFWASKLHFYFTDVPFYNFPYTFGYLMSNGLYARAKEGDFGPKFDAFLEDTSQMRVEDLAMKHLGVDLTKPDFWRESIAILTKDVELFL